MMSKNTQKAAYILSLLAFIAVAFFGMSTAASAQSYDGYWDGAYYGYDSGYGGYDNSYYDNSSYGNDYCSYYDCYDGGYNNYDYGNGYGYGNNYDCYDCGGSNDYYAYGNSQCYYDCYDYGYDYCYYYDCNDYDYNYGCGNNCGGSSETIINENINTNTNTIINYANEYERDIDRDRDDDIDFDVICIPSDREIEEGERVTFRARVEGVSASRVDFSWSGDVDGDDEEVTERFNREGTYTARVRATYRGQVETDTCRIEVEEEDDRDDDRNRVTLVSTPPVGTPASGVYLSQVPYTGAAENAKLIGFITMLTLSSLAGAYYVVTRKARADRKSFLERFKQDNLASKA